MGIIAKAIIQISTLSLIGVFARSFLESWFGLWSLLLQLIVFTSALDLGLAGGSLRNRISYLISLGSGNRTNKVFCSLLYPIVGMYAFFTVCILISGSTIGWDWLLHFRDSERVASHSRVFTKSICFILLKCSLSIYHTVLYAYEKVHLKCIIDAGIFVVICAVSLALTKLHFNPEVVIVTFFLGSFILEIVGFWLFLRIQKWKLLYVKFHEQKKILRELVPESILFWLQNIASSFLFSSTIYMVSILFFTESAGSFSIFCRFFWLVIGVHFLFLNPLWSGISDALHKRDICWIKLTLVKGFVISFSLVFTLCIGYFFSYKWVIKAWFGKSVDNDSLVILLGLWTILYTSTNFLSIFLNAMSSIKWQVMFLILGSVLNILVGYYGSRILGISGIVFGSIVSLLPLFVSNVVQTRRLVGSYARG